MFGFLYGVIADEFATPLYFRTFPVLSPLDLASSISLTQLIKSEVQKPEANEPLPAISEQEKKIVELESKQKVKESVSVSDSFFSKNEVVAPTKQIAEGGPLRGVVKKNISQRWNLVTRYFFLVSPTACRRHC